MEEILTSLHEREDIQIESSYSDRKESNLVNTFLADGCRCKLNCHVSIGREAILSDTGVIVSPVASSILREKIYAKMLSCFFME